MNQQIGLYALTTLAGLCFVFQQTINAKLRMALDSGLWAGFTNFTVGAIALAIVLVAMRQPIPSAAMLARAPWYAWGGGLLGMVYIVGAVFLIPRLGAATVIALIILGQMVTSMTLDHFGVLGIPVHAINWLRGCGAVLLVAGVAMICRY